MIKKRELAATVAIALLPSLPCSLPAQEAPPATVGRGCVIDSATARRWGALTLGLQPSMKLSDTSARALAERVLIMEIQEQFTAPATLDLWPWPGTTMDDELRIASVGGTLLVTIRDGQLVKHTWQMEPRPTPFRQPVELALERAAASDAVRDAFSSNAARDADYAFKLVAAGADSAPAVPLFRTRLSFLKVDEPARRTSGPAPEYPRAQLRDRVSGSVDLEYVIGRLGRVIPGSVWVIRYTDAAFVKPAIKAVEGSQFVPAMITGCAVAQMVKQRVSFESRD